MFYQNLLKVCYERERKPTTVLRSAGIGSASTYRKYNGTPKSVTLYKIAQELNVDIERLVPLGDMEPETLQLYKALHGATDIASKLQMVRCYNEWTYGELGSLCGVAGSTVKGWACGEVSPTILSIDQMCSELDVASGLLLDEGVIYDCDASSERYSACFLTNISRSVTCLRAKSGLSCSKFAERIGAPVFEITALERNPGSCRVEALSRFSDSVGISVLELGYDIERTLEFSTEFAGMPVGKRVRYFRLRRNQTQEWLSQVLGIQQSRLNKLELQPGYRGCTSDEITGIARALNIRPFLLQENLSNNSFYMCMA